MGPAWSRRGDGCMVTAAAQGGSGPGDSGLLWALVIAWFAGVGVVVLPLILAAWR